MRTLYRALLWLLPAAYRERWSAEMIEAWERDAEAAADRGAAARWSFAVTSLADLGVTLVAIRWRGLVDRRRKTRNRDSRTSTMDAFRSDLRTALRNLTRRPGYAVLAVLTLALGIGANSAIFSLINGVLLKPLPFEDEERLVVLARPSSREADISGPDGDDLRERSKTVEELALFMPFWALDLAGDGEPVRLAGAIVQPSYFDLLGVPPLRGRHLLDSDDEVGGEKVVVLTEHLWRERFGADEGILGRTLRLSDEPYVVVGVAPDSLDVLEMGNDVWIPPLPVIPWVADERGTNNLDALARIRSGVDFEVARIEIRGIFEDLASRYPATNRAKIVEPVPLRRFLTANLRPTLLLIYWAVALVLLIVCANVANLMLLRGAHRRHELGTRLALGGSSYALVRLLLVETALLAFLGGAAGVVLALLSLDPLLALAPAGMPRAELVAIDVPVLAVTGGLSVFVTLAAGLLPAILAVRAAPGGDLGRRHPGARGGRARGAFQGGLIVTEVALAFLLLVGAILLLRSFRELREVELGFDPEGVLAANVVLPEARYGELELQDRALSSIVEAIDSIPSVESAAFVTGAPLTGFGYIGSGIGFSDRPLPEPGDVSGARIRPILGDLRTTLGLTLLSGRDLESRRADGRHEVLVNRSFAERHWPEGSPLGKEIALISWEGEPRWREIVGVVDDVKSTGLAGGDAAAVYMPYEQRTLPWQRFGTLMLKTSLDPSELTRAFHEAVWSVDPDLPLDAVTPLQQLVDRATARERFVSTLTGGFALFALWMAIQGIYGVVAFTVRQRRSEIGLRMALGAVRHQVVRSTLTTAVRPVFLGIVVGALGALAFGRWISGLLYDVQPHDPSTLVLVGLTLILSAFLASALPARHASRTDPATTLRDE